VAKIHYLNADFIFFHKKIRQKKEPHNGALNNHNHYCTIKIGGCNTDTYRYGN